MQQMKNSKAEEIREELETLSEEKYRKFSSGLLPGLENLLGVRIPNLREIAKREAKAGWREYLAGASNDSFEEIMLQGLVIGYAKATPEEICQALDCFVPKIDNWSVCDSTAMTISAAKKYPDIFFAYAKDCIAEGTEFSVRFGIVLLLAHFITDDYYKEALALLNKREFPGYYAKMAAAWVVSVAYVKYPVETELWMKDCLLDDETFNKAVQKIKESYRVSKEAKKRVEMMKR